MALSLCLLAATSFTSQAEDKRPNIVLLLTDDQSYDSVGFSGNTQVKTLNLDKLAKQGVIFDRAYDTTAICMASRAQIFTGLYEFKTGANFTHGPLTKEKWQQSYQVKLREEGYFTGFVGKFGFAVKDEGIDSDQYKDITDLPVSDFDVWYGWPSQGSYKAVNNVSVAKFAKEHPHRSQAVSAAAIDFFK